MTRKKEALNFHCLSRFLFLPIFNWLKLHFKEKILPSLLGLETPPTAIPNKHFFLRMALVYAFIRLVGHKNIPQNLAS